MKVFFNASVILAGMHSPNGASGVLLGKVRSGKLKGEISELILNEALRHAEKLGYKEEVLEVKIVQTFKKVMKAPEASMVEKYLEVVVDAGDAHVLASCQSQKCEKLVTLDKKHLLILKGKVAGIDIVSPGELLGKLTHS